MYNYYNANGAIVPKEIKFKLTIFIIVYCLLYAMFVTGCGMFNWNFVDETTKIQIFVVTTFSVILIIIIYGIIPNKGSKRVPIVSLILSIKLRKPLKEMNAVMSKLISEGKLNNTIKMELISIIEKYHLKKEDIQETKSKVFNKVFNKIIGDQKISESEKKDMEEITRFFEMSLEELQFDQDSFNRYYTLGKLEEGIIPVVKKHDLRIIFKKDEALYWAERAEILRTRRITERVSFSGPRGSIRIMKGLFYKYGSYNVETYEREVSEIFDTGIFWITNLRVGYIGDSRNFTCNINQIHSITADDGLKIFKAESQKPFQVCLNDYEVSLRILSKLLNKEEE